VAKMWLKHIFGQRIRYLSAYLEDVMRTGKWKLYQADRPGRNSADVCLAGPILISVLLYLGGVY